LGDHLALPVRITPAVEYHLDGREALARRGAYRLDVFGTCQQLLQGPRHQRLDLLRVESGRLGLYEYMRRREVRKHVEARVDQRPETEERDQDRQAGDDPGMRQ